MKKPLWLPKEEFDYIYSKVRRICVDLVIVTSQGILLSKRDIPPAKGYWHFPGGSILRGETINEAAKRVAENELGIKIEIDKLLGVIEFSETSGFGQPISIVYLVHIINGIPAGSDQAKEINYFKSIPDKMISEQVIFAKENHLLDG